MNIQPYARVQAFKDRLRIELLDGHSVSEIKQRCHKIHVDLIDELLEELSYEMDANFINTNDWLRN